MYQPKWTTHTLQFADQDFTDPTLNALPEEIKREIHLNNKAGETIRIYEHVDGVLALFDGNRVCLAKNPEDGTTDRETIWGDWDAEELEIITDTEGRFTMYGDPVESDED